MCLGVSDPSTFLGLRPCPRMIKDPHMHEPTSDTWIRGPRRKGEFDRGSQGAKTPQKYFK